MDNIVIKRHKENINKQITIGAIFTVLSLLLFVLGIVKGQVIYLVIGILGVLYFLYATVSYYKFSKDDTPLLMVDENGVTDHTTNYSPGFIPYAEIKSFEKMQLMGKDAIGIHFEDTESFLNGLKGMEKKTASANLKYKYPPCVINSEALFACNMDEILEVMNLKLQKYKENINKEE